MVKKIGVLVLIFSSLVLGIPAFALEKPQTPTPPAAPSSLISTPEAPEPPSNDSGDYAVPQRPGLRVRVFAHPPRPETPGNPLKSPSPTASTNNVCQVSDPQSDNLTTSTGWHLPANVTYRLNTSSVPPSVGGSNLYEIVNSGFGKYSAETNGKVAFTIGTNTSINRSRYDGQNIIAWNRLSSGTLGVTYTWYWPSSGLVAETDTIMNNRYKWSWWNNPDLCPSSTTYDAQNIMTHELGHWMGLDDMYDAGLYSNNTMYGYGSTGEVKKNTLTNGDIAGVASIYP